MEVTPKVLLLGQGHVMTSCENQSIETNTRDPIFITLVGKEDYLQLYIGQNSSSSNMFLAWLKVG